MSGDITDEPNETVLLNLSNAVNATIADSQGSGTVTNDDGPPTISVSDVTHDEGNAGTTAYSFTVSLNKPAASDVTVDYATADNTATAGTDYNGSRHDDTDLHGRPDQQDRGCDGQRRYDL